MSIVYKSKSQIRAETAKQLEEFLKRGGSIEVVKARKAPKQKMTARASRGFIKGSSGFANGYPKKTTGAQ